jgi:hypothetical protein
VGKKIRQHGRRLGKSNYGCKTKVQHQYNSQGKTERNITAFAKEERYFWAAADWIWEINDIHSVPTDS